MSKKFYRNYDYLRKTKEMIREYYPEYKKIEMKLECIKTGNMNYVSLLNLKILKILMVI